MGCCISTVVRVRASAPHTNEEWDLPIHIKSKFFSRFISSVLASTSGSFVRSSTNEWKAANGTCLWQNVRCNKCRLEMIMPSYLHFAVLCGHFGGFRNEFCANAVQKIVIDSHIRAHSTFHFFFSLSLFSLCATCVRLRIYFIYFNINAARVLCNPKTKKIAISFAVFLVKPTEVLCRLRSALFNPDLCQLYRSSK